MHNALILHYQTFSEPSSQAHSVRAEDIAAQLALIRKLKMPVVSLEELVENDYKRKRWHRHVLLITCTHTFLAQNPTVFQYFKASGFPVTVFISEDASGSAIWPEWIAAGFSLGLHSVFQVPLHKIPEPTLQHNLSEAKHLLETETGQAVRFLFPASGDLRKKQLLAAQETGFEAVLMHKVGFNKFNADLFHLKTWPVPPHTSLKAFEHMLCRDKKELLVQEVKNRTLKNGSKLRPKSLFGKLKGLLREVRV